MASRRATSKSKNWIHFNLHNIDRTTKTDKELCGVEEPSAESKIHGKHTKDRTTFKKTVRPLKDHKTFIGPDDL